MMRSDLSGKTVLVTGAGGAIGSSMAAVLGANGAAVAVCDIVLANAEKTAAAIREAGGKAKAYYFDVTDPECAARVADEIENDFGGIDILINNAGIANIGLLTDMDIEDWNLILSTNLTSVFSTCRCAVPCMVHNKQGKIINISSVWGIVGASCEVAYSACKGGVNAFTRALAKELAPSNIQVNAIACGVIDTDMNACFSPEERRELEDEIPAGRYGTPEEVAELAFSLAAGHSYLTGQVITLDGGWI